MNDRSGGPLNERVISGCRAIGLPGREKSNVTPQAGEHHDLFEMQTLFEEIRQLLTEAGIGLKGLFLNADSGFDSDKFRAAREQEAIIANVRPNPGGGSSAAYKPGQLVFDEVLYMERGAVERANAWLDSFKTLLVRFEFSVRNCKALHFMAFFVKSPRIRNLKQVHY